jgi:N4-gp56 family major capsid protein
MALTAINSLSVNKAAYEKLAYYALRPELYYDAFVDVKPTNLTNNGVSAQFNITDDLAPVTTPVAETADITPVAMSDTYIILTPTEYMNAVQLTAKNEATAFMEVNPLAANVMGFNAGISVDSIARNAFQLGTNFKVSSVSTHVTRATIAATDVLIGNDIRFCRTKLADGSVQRIDGGYIGIAHPDVVYDFMAQSGGTNWSDPHVYGQDQSGIMNGYVGRFQGVKFIESPRAPLFVNGSAQGTQTTKTTNATTATDTTTGLALVGTTAAHGYIVGQAVSFGATTNGLPADAVIVSVPSTTTFNIAVAGVTTGTPSVTITAGTVDVYGTLIFGKQAFGKAFQNAGGYRINPVLNDIPVIDVGRRFTGVAWKHMVAYGVVRQAAAYRIESASSIGSN